MQDENPYQSPIETKYAESPTEASEEWETLLVASRLRRFLTLILDVIASQILSFCIGIVIFIIARITHCVSSVQNIPDMVFGVVVILIYYVPQEAMWGKTLGKLVTGTIVVSEDGEKPSLAQIVGRTFCRMIPFEPFSFLIGGSQPVGWHDKFSHTRVVMDQ